MDYFDKSYHPPGTPPGTLVAHEPETEPGLSIHILDYDGTRFLEKTTNDIEACRECLREDTATWIHLQGQIQPATISTLGDMFDLHFLAMEDVLNVGQRPKLESYDDQLFMVLSMPEGASQNIRIRQISLFFGHHYVISFCGGEQDPFQLLRQRLKKQHGNVKMDADYILYTIFDLVIDQGYPTLESLGETIEDIESRLLEQTDGQEVLAEIHQLRRELLLLRRNLWPQREILSILSRPGHDLIKSETLFYFRDVYDHIVQILDLTENYREMAGDLVDVYLSASSQRLNEIMRILTIIATIFIPLTFIVGVYGMNFHNPDSPWSMPELGWHYGYPLVWLLMIGITVGMLVYFKRNKWF